MKRPRRVNPSLPGLRAPGDDAGATSSGTILLPPCLFPPTDGAQGSGLPEASPSSWCCTPAIVASPLQVVVSTACAGESRAWDRFPPLLTRATNLHLYSTTVGVYAWSIPLTASRHDRETTVAYEFRFVGDSRLLLVEVAARVPGGKS